MTQNIFQELANRLAKEMPKFWEEMNPFFSKPSNLNIANMRAIGLPIFSVGSVTDITDFFNMPPFAVGDLFGCLIDCIKRTLQAEINEVYLRMGQIGQRTTISDCPYQLLKMIGKMAPQNQPIRLFYIGANLVTLSLKYPNFFMHNGERWFFMNIPIYEILLPYESTYSNSFLVLLQEDMPYIDLERKYFTLYTRNDSIIIQDTYLTLEIYEAAWEDERSCIRRELMIRPLVPILYNPFVKLHSLKVERDDTTNNPLDIKITSK